jgi:hypothetical protein
MKKFLIAAATTTALVAAGLSTSVNADGVYKTEHISLRALGDNPLRSGSVTNIHANGPIVYANEQYHLNGAEANTRYGVFLEVWVTTETVRGDGCSNDPTFVLGPTSSFTTNKAGNGHGKARFAPEDVFGLPTSPVVHGVNWVFREGAVEKGAAAYETGCQPVVLD